MTSDTTGSAAAPSSETSSSRPSDRSDRSADLAARARHARHTVWRLVVTTVSSCLKYRVTGLAAEGAFFAVVSVPPLIFALAGAVGYVSEQFSPDQVDDVRRAVIELCGRFLTESAVDKVIAPTVNDVLRGGRLDVISLGFVLSLWSGSRALNVFVDTITIMHGLGGHRGIVKTRALAFGSTSWPWSPARSRCRWSSRARTWCATCCPSGRLR